MIRKVVFPILLISFFACNTKEDVVPIPDEDVLLGGETSIEGAFVNIFQQPAPSLSVAELDLHRDSDRAFADMFVTAPSTINSGLGPVFNQASCESCHTSNGRSPFPTNSNNMRGLLLRISSPGVGVHGEPLIVEGFGGQFQTKATYGIQPEGTVNWEEVEEIKQYLDGGQLSLRKFNFNIQNTYTTLPSNTLISPRMAPAIIGLGLLEAINKQDIVALADPDDANADGISGKPNYVWNYETQQVDLGRFGWKASQPTLYQQTAAAYRNDMGVTNTLFPQESSFGQPQADGLPDEPEIDETLLRIATFYAQSLAVPMRRNWDNITVQKGKKLFNSINCGGCHQAKFVTGQHSEYTFLSNQTIYPYTDMLLHDMGEGLADNRPDFEANGREWRTPALWGIGLTETVGGHTNFLHDGRARSLEEAIMWHGGEASKSQQAFVALTKSERDALIAFLKSL